MKSKNTTYVALLRGINIGGNKKVPMAQLKTALEKAGLRNVKTLLASGNVILDAGTDDPAALKKTLQELIEREFGFPVPVIIRTLAQIQALIKANPFKGIAVSENTRLYVSFLSEKTKSSLKIPHMSPDKSFSIINIYPLEVISVMTVTPGQGTPQAMNVLEKEFGKNITTRNWNTVLKLVK